MNHYEEEHGELNIVPYLDVMVNLIMFLLVSQATFVSLGVIDVTAPSYAAAGTAGSQSETKESLRLTLGIAQDGFYIAAKGGVLPGQSEESNEITQDGVTKRPPTIPLKADGGYDYPALRRRLREIKTVFPDATAVYLTADSNTPYEIVVKTLDNSREDRKGLLFPNVAFSRIN